MRRLFALCLLLLCLPLPGLAENRFGLIIGNDTYADVPRLNKARADAVSVSGTLRAQGFDVITVLDAPRREMNRRISEFTNKLQPGDTAFVFYAGHGGEIDGDNYLLPTDIIAPASGERDFIKSESISLSRLLDRVRATGARTTIAVIDACRNNPFAATKGRSIGSTRGLGRITAPEGTFVIFSAGAGQLALDELGQNDPARNSVFTRLLLPRLANPDLELRELMSDLRIEVRNLALTVNHEQFPAYYDELLGEFYFARAAATVPVASLDIAVDEESATSAPQSRMARPPADPMRQDFDLARDIGTAGALQAFLDRYADRSSEFTYRLAVQLLEQKSPAKPAAPAPVTTVAEPEKPAPAQSDKPDRREIIRQSQARLNALGCNAGGADGVIGQRTRRAFARFLADSGASLAPSALGTQAALNVLNSKSGKVCKTVVAAPAPEAPNAPSGGGFNLAGSWRFKANCLLVVQTTGSVSYSRTGPNTFRGTVRDSLGQTATTTTTLTGRKIKSVLRWNTGVTTYGSGTLSADGNSYTLSSNNGCVARTWRR